MSGYARGVYAEKRAAKLLRADGYYVVESRGSHGPADLAAIKPGQVLLVQVKSGDATLHSGWWNDLLDAARRAGAIPVIADYPTRGKMRLRRITAPHRARSKLWPCVPFTADEVA